MKVKIAVNRKFTGKPKSGGNAFYKKYNGQFCNEELTPYELMFALHSGYGITPQHNDYRHSKNFICGQHLGLDFDTGDHYSSIDYLRTVPFIAQYASIIYTTPSHTESEPRARVIFLLDAPVYNAGDYGKLAAGLLWHFEQADKSCKDAARFYFGAGEGGHVVKLKTDGLPLTVACELAIAHEMALAAALAEQQTIDAQRVTIDAQNVPAWLLDLHAGKLLHNVRTAPDGEKWTTLRAISRTFGGYVASGYYTESQARGWLQKVISARQIKSKRAAFVCIDNGLDYGKSQPLHFTRQEQEEQETEEDRQARERAEQTSAVFSRLGITV
jgi:hypothetical protein